MNRYKSLINGQWLDSDRVIEVKNKYDGNILGTVPVATRKEIDAALTAAQSAFEIVSAMPAHQRAKILQRTSELIEANKEEIAAIITQEAGKAWKYALSEVGRAVQTFKFAAEEAKQIHGETIPMDASEGSENRFGFYYRCPIGIIVAITPFNFPINLVAHKVAPAIAAGNSVVLKPASTTPLTAVRLGEILLEAGLPPGALNIVFGSGGTVGEWLVMDPRPAMVTFTGSPPVGLRIKSIAGMKRVTLELGNNSATIIDDDADLDLAVARTVMGSFANSGQVCISVQRIYVHQSVYDTFLEKFILATRMLKVGNPLDKDCDVGPMIDETEAIRAEAWVQEAAAQGANIVIGGRRQRAMFEPTVLTNVSEDMKVVCEEVFAPVVSVVQFDHIDQAIHAADNTQYGLQAGIFTSKLSHAFSAVRGLNVGGVMINDVPTFRVDHMPYGGNKLSGIGREGVKFAMEEMTNIKMVCFNL